MKMLKSFFFVIPIIHLSTMAAAHETKRNLGSTSSLDNAHVWVVSTGTKLVAGNPDQNEFYILDRNEPIRTASLAPKINSAQIKVANKATKIIMANKGHRRVGMDKANHLVAANKLKRRITIIKESRITVARGADKTVLPNKIKLAKITLALNKALDSKLQHKNLAKKAAAMKITKHKVGAVKIKRNRLDSSHEHFEFGRAYAYR